MSTEENEKFASHIHEGLWSDRVVTRATPRPLVREKLVFRAAPCPNLIHDSPGL